MAIATEVRATSCTSGARSRSALLCRRRRRGARSRLPSATCALYSAAGAAARSKAPP